MTTRLKYIPAPAGWTCTAPNPFTPDGSYGPAWSAFCIEDRDDNQLITGQSGSGPFAARFGRGCDHLEHRLADYLRYEGGYRRTVILSLPAEMNVNETVARALSCTPAANVVRPYDPTVIIHATTLAAWESIQADGALKAASQLTGKKQHPETFDRTGQIAQYLSHEPVEYPDYIMFGEMDSYVPEMVIASYRAGRFVLDPNAVFEPGIRLYFDAHRIIQNSQCTRDGLHSVKVHRSLPLRPYLIAAVGKAELDPSGSVSEWTIRAFVDQANGLFHLLRA